jgi:hypothetical protein
MPADSPLIALPLVLPLFAVGVLLCLRKAGEATRHALNILTCAGDAGGGRLLYARVSEKACWCCARVPGRRPSASRWWRICCPR